MIMLSRHDGYSFQNFMISTSCLRLHETRLVTKYGNTQDPLKQFATIWSNAADDKINDFPREFLNQKNHPDTAAIVSNCMPQVVVCLNDVFT